MAGTGGQGQAGRWFFASAALLVELLPKLGRDRQAIHIFQTASRRKPSWVMMSARVLPCSTQRFRIIACISNLPNSPEKCISRSDQSRHDLEAMGNASGEMSSSARKSAAAAVMMSCALAWIAHPLSVTARYIRTANLPAT